MFDVRDLEGYWRKNPPAHLTLNSIVNAFSSDKPSTTTKAPYKPDPQELSSIAAAVNRQGIR